MALFRLIKGGTLLLLSAGLVALAGIFPSDPGCLELITIPAKIHAMAGLASLVIGALVPLSYMVSKTA
ncbi:MAG: hypothetical protein P8Y60_07305 [Calditrichota bacterium]